MSDPGKNTGPGRQRGTKVEERHRTQRPPMARVLFHNDDYTTMEFVVDVLRRFFDKDPTEATRIMLMVHYTGVGVAGVYPAEIAETKAAQATEYARAHEYPLLITTEPV